MRTVLVTGGAGYIGSHTALLLSQRGYEVIILDDLRQTKNWSPTFAPVVQANCADQVVLGTLFKKHKVAAVLHFAASIEVGESVRDPLSYYENNMTNTIALLRAMHTYGVKNIIFSSSCAVYGIPQELPLVEDHPKNPISPYGRTKLMIEQVIADAHAAYGINFAVLRYFNAAGAWPEHDLGERHTHESHLIPLLLRAAMHQTPFTILGTTYPTKDGTCVRDFLHVRDLAQAHVHALENLLDGAVSDYFNLGTGTGHTVKQVVEAVERVVSKPISIVFGPRREGDPAQLVADPSKARELLEFKPRFSELDFIIRSAYAFEQR